MHSMKHSAWALGTAVGLLAAAAAEAQVPQPRLTSTQPTGARAGTTVELKLTGGIDLDTADRLVFSHAGISAEPVVLPPDRLWPQGKRVPATFRVKVASDVPSGIYEVRAAGYFGISNGRRFVVTDQPEALEKEPNNDPSQATEIALGAVANGACDAAGFDHYTLAAKKGQRVIVDAMSLRIDSRAQLVLSLLDASGREVQRSAANKYRDPMIDFTPEADGAFVLRVHDLTFRGGDDYFYRISSGTAPWIDFVDPPVLQAGKENAVTVYGRNLPGGQPAEGIAVDGRPLEKLTVATLGPDDAAFVQPATETLLRPADASGDFVNWRLAGPGGRSNAVRLLVGDEPLVAESEPGDTAVTPPVQVVGRFHPQGDRDGVVFEAKKGDKLWIEVFSQRLGLPTDPIMVLQQGTPNEKGEVAWKDLQDVDDQGTPLPAQGNNIERRYRMAPEDPGVLFTAPADGRFRVMVRDLYFSSQGDPRFFWRMVIRPARPDFRLLAIAVENYPAQNRLDPVACVLRRGGAERVRILAFRREGFDQAVRIEADGLPPGMTARPVILQPSQTAVEMVFHCAPDAPAFAGAIRLTGKAEIDGKQVARPVRGSELVFAVGDMQRDTVATRVTDALFVAVDDRFVSPVSVQAGGAGPVRTSLGGKVKLPIKLVKHADFKDLDKAQVKVVALGLPGARAGGGRRGQQPQNPNQGAVTVKEVTLTLAKPEGEIELDVTEAAPPGAFSFFLAGDVDMPYQKNPDRVKKAADEQKRLEELTKTLADDAKKAAEAKAKAEQEAQAAAAELAKAKAASPAAEAAVNEAQGKVKAAEEARAKAVEAEKKLADVIKALDAAKKEMVAEAKVAGDAAKEKRIKLWVATQPVTVEVVSHPVSLKLAPEVSVKPGEKAELEVKAAREFEFADELKLELVAPSGSAIRLAEPAAIAAGQTAGKLVVAAEKNARPGSYAATVRVQVKFNGKTLPPLEVPLQVKVEAP
jgi:hypothetical protein